MSQTSWDGTADTDWYNASQNTFTLTTSEQLAGFASLVNNGNNFSGKTINLSSDISLSNRAWTPIGNAIYFNGTFNGNGYVIKNFSINSVNSQNGLFRQLNSNGTIRNLGVASSDITGHTYVGGLVAYNYGSIINCYSRASVSGDSYVGGLVGFNQGSISYSYSAGTVTANYYVGGLVGENGASGSVSSSYYDSGISNQNDEGKGTPKTTLEMKQQSTFSGWNFSVIWGINNSINNGYPHLFGSFVSQSSSSSSLQSSSSINPATLPFSETFENEQNDWVFVNGNQINKWMIGTATAHNGSLSAYISSNNSDNSYSLTSVSYVHIYRDITFPVSSSDFVLTFYFKGVGEKWYGVNGNTYTDYMRVSHSAISSTPVAGSSFDGTRLMAGYGNNPNWSRKTILLPADDFSGKTRRLVFTWVNNSSDGTQPPAAIDDISISEYKPSTAATLPFLETFENEQNDWVFVNEDATYDEQNKWIIGSATAYSGSYSAYISKNGLDNLYKNISSRTHIYRDITFPVSSSDFTLEYYFKGVGGFPKGYPDIVDCMEVRYSDTTFKPKASDSFYNGDRLALDSGKTSWTLKTIPLPANDFSGKTKRLVFTWINYSNILNDPPAAIDNICIYASGDDSICRSNTPSSSSAIPSSSSETTPSSSSSEPSSSSAIPSSSSETMPSSSSSEPSSSSAILSSSSETTPMRLPQIANGNNILQIRNGINLQVTRNAVVKIYNLNGKLIGKQNFTEGVYNVSLGYLPKGLYVVKATFGNEKKLLKVLVK
jgi:hypothetical protein